MIMLVAGASGAIATGVSVVGGAKEVGGTVVIGGISMGSGAAGGAIAGALAAATIVAIVILYKGDRCNGSGSPRECLAGAVSAVIGSFDTGLDTAFPFTAMHSRIDVTVRSKYWDVIESGGAFVHCTTDDIPRRSEIMRCYYYETRVCSAATGAVVGSAILGAAGVAAAAVAAAAIGCATIYLCLLGLLVAVVICAVAALIGAFAGGNIGRATASGMVPTTSNGTSISVGDFVTTNGPMDRREHDEGANVLWWVTETALHGRISAMSPATFSYVEIDDELVMDSCPA